MKKFYLFLIVLGVCFISSTQLYAQYNAVTLGGNSANNELQIVVDNTGSYMINRWISGSWRNQFYSTTNSDLFVIKMDEAVYRSKTMKTREDVSSVTVGTNQEMTKKFTNTHEGNTFTVTMQFSYNTSSPEYFIKTATIDATNIPSGTAITLGYGYDTYLGTSDRGYAYILPDIFGLNDNPAQIDMYLTTAQVQSLRLVGASNNTAGGAVIGLFPIGRNFDKANVCTHANGVGTQVVNNIPGNGTSTGTIRQNWFQFGPFSTTGNDNNHGVAYDNIPAGEITEVKVGHSFTATLDGELDYFWNGLKNYTANIGDNVTLDLNYLSYSAVLLGNVGFRVDHTGLQIRTGGCTSSGFTGGVHSCTVGSEFYQLVGASVFPSGTATVSVPVNITRAGQWVVDGSSISNMSQTLPFGEPAILTVATTVSLLNNTAVNLCKGDSRQFVVKFPDSVIAANDVTVNLNYTGATTSYSSIPATVTIPAGQNGATFTVTASPTGADNAAMTVTLSSTNQVFTTIAPPSAVLMTIYPQPVISALASSSTVCAGDPTTFTATVSSGSTTAMTYTWTIGGTSSTTTSNTYVATLTTISTYSVRATNSYGCTSSSTTPQTITVTPNVTLTITTSASGNNICSGTTVTYSSTITNGGTAPSYQWRVNGLAPPIGGTGSTYSYEPSHGDVITCVLTSNDNCPVPNPVTSSPIIMAVIPTVTPSVTISGVPD
ncbi:MAG: hypothetical protein LBH91_06860 [Prevotellaceae bacterium]|nr:hypothetical protein [Prevotellaceae bacterium]